MAVPAVRKVNTYTLLDDWHSDYLYDGKTKQVVIPQEKTLARKMLEFSHNVPVLGVMAVGAVRAVIALVHIIFHFFQAALNSCHEEGPRLYLKKAFYELGRAVGDMIPFFGYLFVIIWNPLDGIDQDRDMDVYTGGFRIEPIVPVYEQL